MKVEFWAETHVGRVRDHNEDNFLIDADRGLFVVCDGMGGHAAGEVASGMAAEVIRRTVADHAHILEGFRQDPTDKARHEDVLEVLEAAIQRASQAIYVAAQNDETLRGMGTTCSLLLFGGQRACVGHVGDSRIYRTRSGEVDQITEDHSLLNEMIRRGQAKRGDAIPNKNAVTRAVGVRRDIDVDTFTIAVRPGDVFLLCSDGLSEYLADGEHLEGLLAGDELDAMVEACIEHALAQGGEDNVTAIVARAVEGDEPHTPESRLGRLLSETQIFGHVDALDVPRLSRIAEWDSFEPDDRVESSSRLYVVADGAMRRAAERGDAALFERGSVLGARGLLDESARTGEFDVVEAAEVVGFEYEALSDVLRRDAALSARLMYGLATEFAGRLGGGEVEDEEQMVGPPELPAQRSAPSPPSAGVVHKPEPVSQGSSEPSSSSVEDGEGDDESSVAAEASELSTKRGRDSKTAEMNQMRKTIKLDKPLERDSDDRE